MKRSRFGVVALALLPVGVLFACGGTTTTTTPTPTPTPTPEAAVETGTTPPPSVDSGLDTGIDATVDTGIDAANDTGVDAPPPTFSIGGTLVSLSGNGLVLQNNGKDDLPVAPTSTSFLFQTKLASNATYAVTIKTQPENQACKVTNGTGTIGAANVANVVIDCTTKSSCKTIHDELPTLPSGPYKIDPDGAGGFVAPFNAYCDMDFDDGNAKGGWTLMVSVINKGGPSSTAFGPVMPNTHASLPPATAQALAKVSSQVHLRSTGKAATESVTSKPNNEIIANLRNLLVLNEGLLNEPVAAQAARWTGPFATTQYLAFGCATNTAKYPDMYWACLNSGGFHLVSTWALWVWNTGDPALNLDMEAYVR